MNLTPTKSLPLRVSPTQLARPFSVISNMTFFQPKHNPMKKPDSIENLIHVDTHGTGFKPHLLYDENLPESFITRFSCLHCKGIFNNPMTCPSCKQGCCNVCYCKRKPFCCKVEFIKNEQFKLAVENMNVVCPLYGRGCGFICPISKLYNHLENCVYKYVYCPYEKYNSCSKNEVFMIKQLQAHKSLCHKDLDNLINDYDKLKSDNLNLRRKNKNLELENIFLKQKFINGELIIQISELSNQVEEFLESPIFTTLPPPHYSTPEGYKLQVLTKISNKVPEPGYISLFFAIRDGVNDKDLPWPMNVSYHCEAFSYDDTISVTYTLLKDQIPEKYRIKGAVELFGWNPLLSYQEIMNKSLLFNNSMYLKINVQCS